MLMLLVGFVLIVLARSWRARALAKYSSRVSATVIARREVTVDDSYREIRLSWRFLLHDVYYTFDNPIGKIKDGRDKGHVGMLMINPSKPSDAFDPVVDHGLWNVLYKIGVLVFAIGVGLIAYPYVLIVLREAGVLHG